MVVKEEDKSCGRTCSIIRLTWVYISWQHFNQLWRKPLNWLKGNSFGILPLGFVSSKDVKFAHRQFYPDRHRNPLSSLLSSKLIIENDMSYHVYSFWFQIMYFSSVVSSVDLSLLALQWASSSTCGIDSHSDCKHLVLHRFPGGNRGFEPSSYNNGLSSTSLLFYLNFTKWYDFQFEWEVFHNFNESSKSFRLNVQILSKLGAVNLENLPLPRRGLILESRTLFEKHAQEDPSRPSKDLFTISIWSPPYWSTSR